MKRTQIYLTNEQWRELTILSSEEKVPISELIRRAIDRFYKHNGDDDFDQALEAVTGMWKDRADIGTTDEYVRSLRDDNRLEGLGL